MFTGQSDLGKLSAEAFFSDDSTRLYQLNEI